MHTHTHTRTHAHTQATHPNFQAGNRCSPSPRAEIDDPFPAAEEEGEGRGRVFCACVSPACAREINTGGLPRGSRISGYECTINDARQAQTLQNIRAHVSIVSLAAFVCGWLRGGFEPAANGPSYGGV